MGNVPLICAALAVAFLAQGGSDVEARWLEHCERAEEHLKHREAEVTDEEIRRADAAFATAAGIARDAGRDDLLLKALFFRYECLDALNDFPALLEVGLEILAIQQSIGDGHEAAITQQNLGYFHSVLGDLDAAIACLQESEEWFLAANRPDDVAQARMRLASVCSQAGQPWLALGAAEAAYREFRKQEDRLSLMEASRVLSSIYLTLGDSQRALKCAREAAEHARVGDDVDRVLCRQRIGQALFRLGYANQDARMVEGRDLVQKAARELMVIGDAGSAGSALMSLASMSMALGDERDALRQVETLLALSRKYPRLRAGAYALRGDAHLALGEYDLAAASFRKGLDQAGLSGRRRIQIGCHAGLARICHRARDSKAALAHVEQALAAVDSRPPNSSPLALMGDRKGAAGLFRTALGVAFSLDDPAQTFELIERSRAASLVDGLGSREAFLDRDFPKEFYDRLDEARAHLSLARRDLARADHRGVRRAMEATGQRVREAEDAYRVAIDPMLRGEGSRTTPPRKLAEVQALLAGDQALVLYAFTNERLHAFVVTAKDTFRRDLGARADIETTARRLRDRISGSDDPVPASALAGILIEKLQLPTGIGRLLVSPDGILAHLPFALLEPVREVAFVPSATSYAMLVEASGEPGDDILAMGDPVYSRDRLAWEPDERRGGPRLHNLPGTELEVCENTGPGDIRLLGAEATEQNLRRTLPRRARWRAVHLACHGLRNLRRPAWSALALTPEGREDGYLTVLDVYTMRVPADLVVLSACDSGVGRQTEGEGSLGLPNAFMHAGSSRVLASLWQVEDEPTRAFMKEFYRLWKKPGTSAARALRGAQEAVKKAGYRHPRHWAAWMLWGIPD